MAAVASIAPQRPANRVMNVIEAFSEEGREWG
jgi:hypothetical protein